MAQIRPEDLPAVPGGIVDAAAALIVDDGAGVWKATPAEVVESGVPAVLGVSGGSGLIGFLQAGAGAVSRPVQSRLRDTLSVKDYGTLGDGTAADAAFAAARNEALANGIKRIIIPSGHYLLTNFSANLSGVTWEGDGDSSRLTVGAANSNIMAVSGADNIFRGVRFEGDGTSSATSNGNGILVNAGGLVCEDVTFDTLGQGCIYGSIVSTLRGPKLIRLKARNNGVGSSGFPVEVFLNGGWQDTLLEDADFVTSASLFGLLIAESGSAFWTYCEVRGGWFEGFVRYGVAATDEGYTGADRVHGFFVNGGYYKSCAMGAIKVKQAKIAAISGIEAESCGASPESAAAGLRGAVLLHGVGSMSCSDSMLRNCGSSGIQVSVPFTAGKMFPSGLGMPTVKIHDNIVEGAGVSAPTYGDGIGAVGPCKDISIHGNTCRNFARYGIYVESVYLRNQTVKLHNNNLLDSTTANTQGIYVKDAWLVQQDGNNVSNVDMTGCYYEDVAAVQIGTADRAGDSQSTSYCYNFATVGDVKFDGSASCSVYAAHATTTAYTIGQRVYADTDKVYEVTVAGTTAGATPPTGTGTAIVDGTVTWSYVMRYRKNNGGLNFSTVTQCVVGAAAQFENLVGAWATGSMPTILRRASYYTNSSDLVGGEATFTLTWPEPDNNYIVTIDGNANETFYALDADKTTTTFKAKSGNGASTVLVRVSVSR